MIRWRALWQALRGLTPQTMSQRWMVWKDSHGWEGPSEKGLR